MRGKVLRGAAHASTADQIVPPRNNPRLAGMMVRFRTSDVRFVERKTRRAQTGGLVGLVRSFSLFVPTRNRRP